MSQLDSYDLLVVGGGPAGLAAAGEASSLGLSVLLADERPTLGGQIFKQPGLVVRNHRALGSDHLRGRALIEAVERSGTRGLLRTSCVTLGGTDAVLVTGGEAAHVVTAGGGLGGGPGRGPPRRLPRS